ncbi:MAG: isoleucine--tRNA ligase [Anaerolineaceae bacterium]|nr:isoleucine--tRNA ligase [Anaerolineaceae bacterium]
MAIQKVPNKIDFIAQEHDVLGFWKENKSFEKLRQIHKGKSHWSFIDGPITANNPMGVHHGWGRTYKDVFNRFWAMRGHELRYQNGFDCQGLWVEVEVEKELGFNSKTDIIDFGMDKFVRKCKERVLKFASVQTEQSIRLGYWMDWNDTDMLRDLAAKLIEDPNQEITVDGPEGPVTDTVEGIVGRLGLPEMGGSYFTFSNENNYMIWSFLQRCWERGWVYQGADVMPWCPRCSTGISHHEIVTDGYMELTHASVVLRFPLRGRENESLLVWTTTPWTLTSNVAAAVGPELDYVKVKSGEEFFYLSKGTLKMMKGKFEIVEELKGKEMEGWAYDGPFDELEAQQNKGGFTELIDLIKDVNVSGSESHHIILWDEVGDEEGTGIVHIAPGAGAEDFILGKENGLPIIAPLNEEGYFIEGFGFLTGMQVSDVAKPIFENLKEKGVLYRVDDYSHRYPTCWRCKTELVFRLVDEWFINMGEVYDKPREELTAEEKEGSLRYQIMDVVDKIRWIPEFGHSRELDWLRNMGDWMISKKRFWGLALPIWTCDECDHFEVIGSDDELKERGVEGLDVLGKHSPHRPFIDAVKIDCPKCGTRMNRIPDVGNPWLDAGVVPFSTTQFRADPEFWAKWYPAHWISESFPGQFRNWFYSLLVMGTVLDSSPPFLENFGYATLYAEDGREMHKSWGNSIEFNEAADKMGVDVMRWLYCAHKPENNLLFGYNRADEVRRGFLIPLWNVYSFFSTYANLDNWAPSFDVFDAALPEGETPKVDNPLDKWLLARINQVTKRVIETLENSDAFGATLVVEPFIEDLTNWYVRRSRRRYWKSEHDSDKEAAYATLYHVLVKLSKLLAPFTPFVSEVIYQNIVRNVQDDAYESVHHTSYPEADQAVIDEQLIEEMDLARRVASLGLSARGSANLKVRQPLAKALAFVESGKAELRDSLVEIVADELNVKGLEFVDQAEKLVSYRILPNNKLLGPKFGKDFPKARAALAALDSTKVAKSVAAKQEVEMVVDGETYLLTAEEIVVETKPAEGLAVAADKGVTVAVDAVLTDELRAEGLAREVVRRIQAMRKNAGFNIEDRITTWYQAVGDMQNVVSTWSEYIKSETLTTELIAGTPASDTYVEEHKVDGEVVTIGIKQN